jgi:hypothetical protein
MCLYKKIPLARGSTAREQRAISRDIKNPNFGENQNSVFFIPFELKSAY